MNINFINVSIAVVTVGFAFVPFFSTAQTTTSYTVDISALVQGCGDSIIQLGEQCDGGNLGGSSCSSVGFSAGTLLCSPACTFNTTNCTLSVPSLISGGSSVLTPAPVPIVPKTNLVITGYSAPGTAVTLLSDGQWVGTAVASLFGEFQMTISGFSAREYLLQLIARDTQNNFTRSNSFIGRIRENSTTKVSNLVLPPIVQVINSHEDSFSLLVRTVPGAMVFLFNDGKTVQTVIADDSGEGRLIVPLITSTSGLSQYFLQTNYGNHFSALSAPINITVPQTEEVSVVTNTACGRPHDINNDCRVNLVDLSTAIYAFFTGTAAHKFDYNNDGKIDIVDFSIMAFYWTG